jgi:hypothetical protein
MPILRTRESGERGRVSGGRVALAAMAAVLLLGAGVITTFCLIRQPVRIGSYLILGPASSDARYYLDPLTNEFCYLAPGSPPVPWTICFTRGGPQIDPVSLPIKDWNGPLPTPVGITQVGCFGPFQVIHLATRSS